MKITFRIKLNSDYHIGAGIGDSTIDSYLFRDSDGQLVIRGTTITGLLGQGLQDIIMTPPLSKFSRCKRSGNPNGPDFCVSNDPCIVCKILGTPAVPKHWYFSSAVPETPEVLEFEPSHTVMRTTVDMKTRHSEENKLFSQEMGAHDLIFTFTVESSSNSDEILKEAAFIVAGFRAVRSIGAFRRRGKGVCHFEVKSTDLDISADTTFIGNKTHWFIKRFKETVSENVSYSVPEKSQPNLTAVKDHYLVILETEEPLLISSNSGDGNVYRGMNYIPGQTLRGALASRVAYANTLSDNDVYNNFINCFVLGGVRFTNCYPAELGSSKKTTNDNETVKIHAMVPIPLNWLFCELDPNHPIQRAEQFQIHDFQDKTKTVDYICPVCADKTETRIKSKIKQRRGFISSKGIISRIEASQVEAHIQMDNLQGTVKRGDLFKYICLPKKNKFAGIIDIRPEHCSAMATLLKSCVDEIKEDGTIKLSLRIGKGYTRGYGLARVELKPLHAKERITVFHHKANPDVEKILPVTMLFLSDAILVDTFGRYIQHFDNDIITDLIGSQATITLQSLGTKKIKGFNTYFGLPRWTEIAIEAGSIIQFDVDGPWDKVHDSLIKLEQSGIGIRKDEGFGMVSFNHPILKLKGPVSTDNSLTFSNGGMLKNKIDEWIENGESILVTIATDFKQSKYVSNARALLRLVWGERYKPGVASEIDCFVYTSRGQIVGDIEKLTAHSATSESQEDDKSKRRYEDFKQTLKNRLEKLDIIIQHLDETARARIQGRALARLLDYVQVFLEEK